MKRATLLALGLIAMAGVIIVGGCGDAPSTPIAPDQPKADPGVPPNIDQMMKGTRERGDKH